MSTLTQFVTPADQPLNWLKLLFVDGWQERDSNELMSNIEALDTSVLETSVGADNLHEKITNLRPDFLILALSSLHQATLEELIKIHQDCPLPVIVIAEQYASSVIETVISAGISSYLIGEVSTERLMVIVDLSIARFKQEQSLKSELRETKEKLSDRKLIERAKGIIMQQKKISEDQAY